MTRVGRTRRRTKKISMETREQIKQLSLMNNAFMNLALEDNIPCVEEMLRVILCKPDLVVKTARTQKMFQGFRRSIYLDIYAEDSNGTRYNIEIQQSKEGADPRRARFHMGMVDVHSLKSGQDFRELPECYVIFITQEDILKRGKTIYTIHKYIDGDLEAFDDGSHTIYVNGAAKDDGTELWKLIHDLHCTNADDMYFPRLSARVKYLKEDEEGMATVSNYFEERQAKAVIEAEKRTKESTALKFLGLGKLTLEEIASCSGLTLKRVQMLAKTL